MPHLLGGLYDKTERLDPLLQMMYLDVKSWLPDDLLIKADKMTMASSVELRVPFLDHRLVELGGAHPAALPDQGVGDEVHPQEGDGALPAARDPAPRQDGVSDAARPHVPGRDAGLRRRCPQRRAHAGPRLLPARGRAAAGRRARGGAEGPPPRALAAPGAGGVAPQASSTDLSVAGRPPAPPPMAVPGRRPSTASMWRASLSRVTSSRSTYPSLRKSSMISGTVWRYW